MSKKNHTLILRLSTTRFISAALAVVIAASPAVALADTFDQQINQLQGEVNQLSGPLQDVASRANSLQEAVYNLNAQIADLQKRIGQNQQKRDQLIISITKAEADIVARSKALSNTLKTMYVDSDVTNLEKVASSKSISDFVDKQEYLCRYP